MTFIVFQKCVQNASEMRPKCVRLTKNEMRPGRVQTRPKRAVTYELRCIVRLHLLLCLCPVWALFAQRLCSFCARFEPCLPSVLACFGCDCPARLKAAFAVNAQRAKAQAGQTVQQGKSKRNTNAIAWACSTKAVRVIRGTNVTISFIFIWASFMLECEK